MTLGCRLVLRLGQRLQSLRRLPVLEPDVGALVARRGKTSLWLHLGRRNGGRSCRTGADANTGQVPGADRSLAGIGSAAACGDARGPPRSTAATWQSRTARRKLREAASSTAPRKVFTTPLFARIALFIFLANVVGTFFYLEQARLVALSIADSATRVEFFSARDLTVSVATLLIEVFGTARILSRFGLTTALLALPVVAALGTFVLSFDSALWIVAAVMVAERIASFALANPAIKVIYTLTKPDEKYKVQNFIDTVVFRGGDATSGWLYAILGGGMGFAAGATPAVALPMVLAWFWVAQRLGSDHRRRAAEFV